MFSIVKKSVGLCILTLTAMFAGSSFAVTDSSSFSGLSTPTNTLQPSTGYTLKSVVHWAQNVASNYSPSCPLNSSLTMSAFAWKSEYDGDMYYICSGLDIRADSNGNYSALNELSNQPSWENCPAFSGQLPNELCATNLGTPSTPITNLYTTFIVSQCSTGICETDTYLDYIWPVSGSGASTPNIMGQTSQLGRCLNGQCEQEPDDGQGPDLVTQVFLTPGFYDIRLHTVRQGGDTEICPADGQGNDNGLSLIYVDWSNIGQTCFLTCSGPMNNSTPYYFSDIKCNWY